MGKLYRIVRGKWKHVTCQCNNCHKQFTTLGSLRRHLLEVHGQVKYQCDKCHKQFASKDGLRRHLLHFVCSRQSCPETKHRREVHGQRRLVRYECDMCHHQFRQIQNLRRHRLEVHGRFQRRGSLKRDAETEVWELQLRKKLDGRQSMASGFWTQAAIARASPERAEAFSWEADDGGCSAAQLSSGIGGLQQPTMLLERPVQAARCAKQQWKQERLTRWMSHRPRCSKRRSNSIGKAAMPDDAFREQIEEHGIRPATDAKDCIIRILEALAKDPTYSEGVCGSVIEKLREQRLQE